MQDMTIKDFDKRLSIALKEKDVTQTELANKTGISKACINHYITGRNSPSTDKVYLIANALCINESWLLGYDVPMDIDELDKQRIKDEEFLNYYSKLSKNSQNRLLDVAKKMYETEQAINNLI